MKIGDQFSFTGHFETAAGADVDPTVVKLFLREELDATELEWIYNASPTEGTHYPTGMNAVVKDSTGDYSVLFVTRKAERITALWRATGNSVSTITQNVVTLLVRHAGIDLAEP